MAPRSSPPQLGVDVATEVAMNAKTHNFDDRMCESLVVMGVWCVSGIVTLVSGCETAVEFGWKKQTPFPSQLRRHH